MNISKAPPTHGLNLGLGPAIIFSASCAASTVEVHSQRARSVGEDTWCRIDCCCSVSTVSCRQGVFGTHSTAINTSSTVLEAECVERHDETKMRHDICY